jgi:hypothetical protein
LGSLLEAGTWSALMDSCSPAEAVNAVWERGLDENGLLLDKFIDILEESSL